MSSLSTLRDDSWSICGEQEGEGIWVEGGERRERGEWPERILFFHRDSLAVEDGTEAETVDNPRRV
jgi:hypothetical protein